MTPKHLALLIVLMCSMLQSRGNAQERKSKLAPELRQFSWMIGNWELNTIKIFDPAINNSYVVRPRTHWLNVSATDDGKLQFRYEYYLYSRQAPLQVVLADPNDIIRHVETIEIKEGKAVVSGEIETTLDGATSQKQFSLTLNGELEDYFDHGTDFDTMQHLSYRIAIQTKRLHSYANANYRPFTPRSPFAGSEEGVTMP